MAAVHGVTKSRARLSDFTFTFHVHALEKDMATHSSVLAWRIPGTGEPGGLPSMGPLRAAAAAAVFSSTHSSVLAWRIPWTENSMVHGVPKGWTQLSD